MKRLQELIEHERKVSVNILNERESYMPKLEEEFYNAEQKYKQCVSNEGLMAKKIQLSKEYPWAVVAMLEKQLEEHQKVKNKGASKKVKIQEKLDESATALAQTENDYESKKTEVAELHKQLKDQKAIQDEVEQKFKVASANYKATNLEIKKHRQNIEKREREKNKMMELMEKQKRDNDKDFDQEREDKERRIKEIEDKLKDNVNLERTKQSEAKMFDAELERLNKCKDEKRFKLNQRENQIKVKEKEIEDFKRSSKNKILRFGECMPDLVADIKRCFQERKFREMPRGPIGMHVEVKDTKWSKAIEQCIGNFIFKILYN